MLAIMEVDVKMTSVWWYVCKHFTLFNDVFKNRPNSKLLTIRCVLFTKYLTQFCFHVLNVPSEEDEDEQVG